MRAFPRTGLILKSTCWLTMCLTGALSTDRDVNLKTISRRKSSEDGSTLMAIPSMVKSMTEMSGIDEKGTKKDVFFVCSMTYLS